jgi:hypothetical protein
MIRMCAIRDDGSEKLREKTTNDAGCFRVSFYGIEDGVSSIARNSDNVLPEWKVSS